MALTITNLKYDSAGSQTKVTGQIAFDSSYPTGGESLTASQLGLAGISNIIVEPKSGYIFDPAYSGSDANILVYNSAGGGTFTGSALGTHTHNVQRSIDEVISVTAGTGISAAATSIPIGIVESVYVTAGGVTGVFKIIPAAATLATTLVKVDRTTGVFTFLVADAVTSATITYLQLATSATSAGTPAGTISSTAGSEISNGTNLSTLTGVDFTAYGY